MMNRAAALFEKLSEADVDWILNTGLEEQLMKGQPLIEAGRPVNAIFIVLKGLLGVFTEALGKERLAVVGPGGVVGEMSLLEDRVPTESVVAQETTTVLVLPHRTLEDRFFKDPHFASRLYRGMAKSLSQRLRRTNQRLTVQTEGTPPPKGKNPAMEAVTEAITQMEALIHGADDAARKNKDAVPDEMAAELVARMSALYPLFEAAAGDAAQQPEDVREQMGLHAQKQLLPYILLTRNAERWFSKPRGYAGDFMTLEMLYQNVPRGTSRVGPMVDRAFLAAPFARALRGRRPAFAAALAENLAASPAEPFLVTSLACGPGTELFDALATAEDAGRLKATMVDFDPQALTTVAEKRDRAKLQGQIDLVPVNPVYLALGRAALEIPEQDLIYATGLVDYFSDDLLGKLLNLVYGLLKPGGKLVLGAIHASNPAKAFMDHVLEWRLIHRTEEDLNRLLGASDFESPCTAIRYDESGVGMLAECIKAPA
jgi:CRP-like cAMP-binding protein/SAM-dependent methyltransferase